MFSLAGMRRSLLFWAMLQNIIDFLASLTVNRADEPEQARHAQSRADMIAAATNQGEWVSAEDMHPMANVWGRLYRDEDGNIWRYLGYRPKQPRAHDWFFPFQNDSEAGRDFRRRSIQAMLEFDYQIDKFR